MDDIAEAAGVTKPVLYQHFPSKRALYVEVLEDVGGRLLEVLAEATASVETGRAPRRAGLRGLLPVRRERPRRVPAAVRCVGPQRPRVRRRGRPRARPTPPPPSAPSSRSTASDEHRQVLAHAHRRDGRGDQPPRARPIRTDRTTPISSPTGSPSWRGSAYAASAPTTDRAACVAMARRTASTTRGAVRSAPAVKKCAPSGRIDGSDAPFGQSR